MANFNDLPFYDAHATNGFRLLVWFFRCTCHVTINQPVLGFCIPSAHVDVHDCPFYYFTSTCFVVPCCRPHSSMKPSRHPSFVQHFDVMERFSSDLSPFLFSSQIVAIPHFILDSSLATLIISTLPCTLPRLPTIIRFLRGGGVTGVRLTRIGY